MLKLILGRISSGKTHRIRGIIKEKVDSGERVMLIVPEQYSFQTEKNMLEYLGSLKADSVEVVSFSFLAHGLLKKYGLNSKKLIDDSTRALMMSLALEVVGDKLDVYSKHRYSTSVIARMLKIVREFRQCAVSGDELRKTAEIIDNELLKSKLEEISLIMDAYTAVTEQSYFDDECALDKLYGLLKEKNEFENITVFVDGFRGFTNQELNVLGRIMALSADTYITLCTDNSPYKPDDFSAFAHTRRTKQKLIRLAEKNSVAVAVPEYIDSHISDRYTNGEMNYLENGLYAEEPEVFSEKTEHITLCSAASTQEECEYVAHTVKKLIRTENLRCRDIAVVSRSENNYSREIRAALKKHGVPVFEDRRQPITSQPLIEFILSAVDIATDGFSVDAVMRVLKTGLTDIENDDIALLENYVLMWQINGNKWLDEWTGHPDGLGETMTQADEKRLAAINSVRVKAVAPLQKLRALFKELNGLTAAGAIYSLMQNMNTAENLRKLAVRLNNNGESVLAAEQNRMWEIAIEILDRIAESLKDVSLTAKRFRDLLNLIISTYTIGTIPQGLDEITVGTADRVKLNSPKVVFAVGLNDGVFPMIPEENGLLSENDRKILADAELKIDDNFEQKMMEERFIAYNTLCSASDRLYISYSRRDESGADMSASEIVSQLESIFPNINKVFTENTPLIDFTEGAAPSFELMARLTPLGGKMHDSLEKIFAEKPEYSGKLKALRRAVNKEAFEITDKSLAKELFGENLYMSASRTEVYHKCPFEYFCKYGLNAKPRQIAELDPMQKGTAIHFILEKLISIYGSDGLCSMAKQDRDKCISDMLNEYFKEILTSDNDMGERFNYLYGQLVYIVCEVVDRLVSEFSVSEFVPVAFELKIDEDGEVAPYEIPLSDGGMLKIKGSVDRVDVMKSKDAAFVRVIDYKSGGKNFNLNEVYSGLNMQMLIYLFTIWKNGFRDYKNIKPAGVLYMPVNAPFAKAERDETDENLMIEKQKSSRMSGMVLDDSRVVYAMDSRGKGAIIPAKITSAGECAGNAITIKGMELLMKRVEKILEKMAISLHEGKIQVMPAVAKSSTSAYNDVCKFCDYKDVCLADEDTPVRDIDSIAFKESVKELGGEDDA